ncbi:YggT family protein [Corynebacterium spheniscorum]|uniref:YggT family protein n=1 Tax=Corynebacterium spheniscorum TaxID=185761 RepID=A0A1I2REP9_9CORY|nr:YggT family protein [Corynebacterium spheniscorum]KAA8722434.1 YggT family protein [Corynebacterium spheniscorum]SFG38940.1 YggT family protein [Corynebacterium spheniscorum]
MESIGLILLVIVRIFTWVLIARLIIEMVQSFSRTFRPPRWFALIAEPLFLITDPPVKLLRKLIPPLPMGGVRLDVSVLVLFFICAILQSALLAWIR